MNTLQFIISSIIIILIPGTGVTYTISNGISNGKRAAVLAALGCTFGILPHLCVSILLSSYLLSMNDYVFGILQIIGCAYLVYLGIGMICANADTVTSENTTRNHINTIILSGILINLLNPKLTLFFFSFLPQYARSDCDHYMLWCLIYGLAFMLLTLIVFILYGLLASAAHNFFMQSTKRICAIQKIFGLIFILFALQLLISSIKLLIR